MLKLVNLGQVDYKKAWQIQKDLQQKLIAGEEDDYLIFCSHPEVITLGRSANPTNILAKESVLRDRDIEVLEIERGGDVTWHGPEQIVCYPILNLNRYKRDVDWYLRQLEEVILKTLVEFDIFAKQVPGNTGIWIDSTEPARKIASIGVRISRWCTLHGFSLNIFDCQYGFDLINPCGFTNIRSASIISEAKLVTPKQGLREVTEEKILKHFCRVFNADQENKTENKINEALY